jgi:hypothetical protein
MIEDGLLRRLKRKAADEGTTLQRVANDLLRRGLAEPHKPAYRLNWKGRNARLRPGIDERIIMDRNRLYDLMGGR